MRWGCQRNNQRSPKTLLFVFRRFACRSAAFLSVWGGQPEREASLFNLKFLAARVRVYVRQLADGRVFAVVCGQPVFEVGVVGADEDGGGFLVKIDFGGLFLLGKSCSHRLLYYTGLRVGELLALTPEDIDFDRHIISVNKNYQRLNGKDYIYPPKTEAGYRDVVIPKVLESCIRDYLATCYDLQQTDRIFPYDKSYVGRQMKYGCDKSGAQKIRVHDVRHTHASLLVDMGCTPLLIAERLGHERVQTTMDTYSHLYPNKQSEVADQLDVIATKDDGYEKTS